MRLLIDIGNSRLKWLLEKDGAFSATVALTHAGNPEFIDQLAAQWRDLPRPDQLAIACVGTKTVLEPVRELTLQYWRGLPLFQPLACAEAGGVTNAYPEPQRLGVDRWLALLAARRRFPAGVCVVDCGTALTVDVVDGEGLHRGGLISPGLRLMRQALASGTAALPFVSKNQQPALANITEAAIDSGTLLSAAGLIETAVRRYAAPYPLLLCGGDAPQLAAVLDCGCTIDMDLVLKGLLIALMEQPAA